MMQEWFHEAKLGIFIHWGAYAVDKRGRESWPFFTGEVSYDEYMLQYEKFNPQSFDPNDWAELIADSGAQYSVLTTKHHDGIALWATKEAGHSIVNKRRETQGDYPDLVEKYLEAIRAKGIRAGLYYSHTDWSCDAHMRVLMDWTEEELAQHRAKKFDYTTILDAGQQKDKVEYTKLWQEYLDFHAGQLSEILGNYGDIDLIWFDVFKERGPYTLDHKGLRDLIHRFSEKTVINSRLKGNGDYETPEQYIPVYPPKGPWELCITTNDTWSYTGREQDYTSPYEIVLMLCECLGMGGNMLLNIGPDENGKVPAQQREILLSLGSWVKKHSEAIYKTQRGLPHGYAYHFSSLNKSKDTLYLYVGHDPKESTPIKGIFNKVKKVSVLGSGAELQHKVVGGIPTVPGSIYIDLPKEHLDPMVTVVKLELDGPLRLYAGKGQEIHIN